MTGDESQLFSISREFDFVRLDGLRRATGTQEHDWDLYVVKELVDNALDADEAQWNDDDPTTLPRVSVALDYVKNIETHRPQLIVRVTNRADFPVAQLAQIFATTWYTSRKSCVKELTRGTLGNALKTLLGIPYALRHRLANDWTPDLKPMTIVAGGREYQPQYRIDAAAQRIQFVCDKERVRSHRGTEISIGIDEFEQERPRTLDQIVTLAWKYHLSNPHAHFQWSVQLGDESWTQEFAADETWRDKFVGTPPIQWYSGAAFQDLLTAICRNRTEDPAAPVLGVPEVLALFPVSGAPSVTLDTLVATLADSIGSPPVLSIRDVCGESGLRLYKWLRRQAPRFLSQRLGCPGRDHVTKVLRRARVVEGEVIYQQTTDDGQDDETPFVLEIALAPLARGTRQVWSSLNFSPTHDDPFRRRWLRTPELGEKPALGLEGILDAYDLGADEPVLLVLNLICPNLEHNEFSKTEINHLPFRDQLGELLDRVLKRFRHGRVDAELQVEQKVFQALDEILDNVGEDERFVIAQLLEKLRRRLTADPAFAAWLEERDALQRLHLHISNYQSRRGMVTQHLARRAEGIISLPVHPDHYVSVEAEHVDAELLQRYHVGKLLVLQAANLEPVVIDNGWLCRMDLALLRHGSGLDTLRGMMTHCVHNTPTPILVVHDADQGGVDFVRMLRDWTSEADPEGRQLVDVGLWTNDYAGDGITKGRLVEMMPRELAQWLFGRLLELKIPVKSHPSSAEIRQDLRQGFQRRLLGHFWEGVAQRLAVVQMLDALDQEVKFSQHLAQRALHQCVIERLLGTASQMYYATVLDQVLTEIFGAFMEEHGDRVERFLLEHVNRFRVEDET
jgi:hypothetical protein